MATAQKTTRLNAELKNMAKNPSPGIHVYLEDDTKLDEMKVDMKGPDGSPYANRTFQLKVQIPDRYPFTPPSITFLTPVYHPNIDPEGRICLSALKPKPAGNWSVTLNIITVLASIRVLLSEPNLSDPLMADIANEYVQNYEEYFKKASNYSKLN